MPLKIAILEDNLDRQEAMKGWLNARLHSYEHLFFDEAAPMNAWLETNLAETLLVSLDHDLDLKPTGDGRWRDTGTGREVADWLAAHAPVCPVIIHSTNVPAADGMASVLSAAGWQVASVRPYGDLAWVGEAWWPLVREQLQFVV